MLDYWVRLHRRLPEREIRQVVIYLMSTHSPLVRQTTFERNRTRHAFEVIRLWEQPTEAFLESPGLLPFAALSRTENREDVLKQVATQIETIEGRGIQSNITVSAAILAGLVLDKRLVQQILRRAFMQESVIYQDIKAEGLQEGLQEGLRQGLQQGRQQGGKLLVLRLLNRKVGTLPAELTARVEALSLQQIEALGEALLDFEGREDLVQWLEMNMIK